jgi:hypothetical protein
MQVYTLKQVEQALADGLLWARMGNGNLWRLRRNGANKLWKRDANKYEIPVKAGLKSCARVSDLSLYSEDNEGRLILERV